MIYVYRIVCTYVHVKYINIHNNIIIIIIVIIITFVLSLLFLSYRLLTKVSSRKTRLYKFDPLKPHFYIVKLGFTGIYIFFLISTQNIDCGYWF